MKTNNLTIENLAKTKWFSQFDESQQIEIFRGLRKKLMVSWYAKPELTD